MIGGGYGWSFVICGFVGVFFVSFRDLSYVFGVVDSLVLYSFIWASKRFLLINVENFPKNPAKSMLATLACFFYLSGYSACIVDSV